MGGNGESGKRKFTTNSGGLPCEIDISEPSKGQASGH